MVEHQYARPGITGHFFAIWLLALLVFAVGCEKKSARVTVLPRATGPLLREGFRRGTQNALEAGGLSMRWEDAPADGDVQDQLGLFQEAASRSAGMILSPEETLAARSVVLQAVRDRIPVVVVDDEGFGPPASPYLSYVSNDEDDGARLAAERLARDLHGHGTVAVVGISPRQEDSLTREMEFETHLRQIAPDIQFVLRQWGDLVVTHQQQICQQLLESTEAPDAIVALSSTATRGALYAKLATRRAAKPVLIGFDQDDPDMLVPILTGEIDAVVMQKITAIGERAALNIRAQIDHRSVAPRTRIAPLLITRDELIHQQQSPSDEVGTVTLPPSSLTSFDQSHIDAVRAMLTEDAKKHELQPGVQSIATFIRSPGRHPAITIQGTVVSLPPMLEVQDETSAVLVPSFTATSPLKVGDEVTVRGDLISERFRSRIEHATINVLWSGNAVAPLAVTALQLTAQYRGESIETEGTVLRQDRAGNTSMLVLRDGTQVFRALLAGSSLQAKHFAPGSRVRLRGTATATPEMTDGIYPFTVVVNEAEEISPPPWWSPFHIAMLSTAAAILAFGAFWTFHAIQRWHMQSVLREREQLAFEMHDTLAQSFTGIAYELLAAQEQARKGAAVDSYLQHALQMVRSSHREASNTIAFLRPRHRDCTGLLDELRQTAERLSASGSLAVTATLSGGHNRLPLGVGDALFRIGQEAISNAIQHGGCSNLAIDLSVSKRLAVLTVRDDGTGFVLSSSNSGLGIKGMRQRAEAVKARFEVHSDLGSGTSVHLSCPMNFASGLVSHIRARMLSNLRSRYGALSENG